MIVSMTGYGKAEGEFEGKKITVELRSLNSKQLDMNTRMPHCYRAKEMDLRTYLGKTLSRGKVDLNINVEGGSNDNKYSLNKELATKHYNELKSLSKELDGGQDNDVFALMLRMPDVIQQQETRLTDEEWMRIMPLVEKAALNLIDFRKQEGAEMGKDISSRIVNIMELLQNIIPFEEKRVENIRERIRKNLEENTNKMNYDADRFEKELIFYMEKLDISEEKTRLKSHCDYFIETIKEDNNGKKLGFICQEIGREINTIGSKANNADIQKIVVRMKDETEKIREQILNVL